MKSRRTVAFVLLAGIWAATASAAAQSPIRAEDCQNTVRLACVGDSITFGSSVKYRLRDCYPAQLGRLLGSEWQVRNFGVGGATMLKKGDKPYWAQRAWKDALEFKPHAVVIKLGTNDTKPQNWRFKDRFETDYREMIAAFRALPSEPRIWICKPAPAFPERWGISDKVIKSEVLPLIERIAADMNVGLIDLYQPLSGKPELFPDLIHPNARGAAIMAGTVYKAVSGYESPGPGVKTLPKVLIIGDSISIGYTPYVKELLAGRADVHHNRGNAQHTRYGLHELENWLGDTDWDVIHFNHGLHDLKYIDENGRNVDASRGHQQIPIEQYEKNLDKLAERLKETGAALIFANTTPTPAGTGFRVKGDSARYNAAAERVMKKYDIPVNDLYSFALARLNKIQRPANVHFYPHGSYVLGEQIARYIENALKDSPTLQKDKQSKLQPSENTWNGYKRYDFTIDDRKCILVEPKLAAPGRPWIWCARFFGHEPQTDSALLAKGYHLAYMDVADLYGSPAVVGHWNAFYDFLTTRYGLSDKAALEGMSRGGLIVYNWATANPEKVSCIYADAPVCDIKSWPSGKGKSPGSSSDWARCLEAYGLTEKQAEQFKQNPIDKLRPLARAGVPLLHICGDADQVVPLDENTAILEERYKKLGGSIETIIKSGVGHHPHSLEDPAQIVDFICKNTALANGSFYAFRDNLSNSRIKFTVEKKGRVAFLGGSITNMKGWRQMTAENLRRRLPETQFEFINAGIPSTDSTLGAFRLASTAFAHGPVDLLFVEFAVNDQHNRRGPKARIQGMEGIIRQARSKNPLVDIVLLYCVDPIKYEQINSGHTPPEIASHEAVARRYTVPSIDFAAETAAHLDAAHFTFGEFGGLHPGPLGHKLYAEAIDRFLNTAWRGRLSRNAEPIAHQMPEPLDPLNYCRGRYLDISKARTNQKWQIVEKWNATDASTRPRFRNIPMLVATEPGARLRLRFQGTAVGMLVVAGPDVGILEYRIDDGPFQTIDQFTQWSPNLHIPWAYMLATDLENKKHRLVLRTARDKNHASKGNAARIVHFLAN